MDALERRSRTYLARSSVLQRGTALWLGGRPQSVIRELLRLAMMRSEDRSSAKQVQMTWTEDTTMNEDKKCLQRDVTDVDVSMRGAGRTWSMFA